MEFIILSLLLLLSLSGRQLSAMGEATHFRIAKLVIPGVVDNRKTAIKRLLWELAKRSSVKPIFEPLPLKIQDKRLFDYPLLFLAGGNGFEALPEQDIIRLRAYLVGGGLLFIDRTDDLSDSPFERSIRRLSKRLFPQYPLKRLSYNHTLFQSFYLIRRFGGRLLRRAYLEGVVQDDRALIIYSANDLHGAWERDSFGNWLYSVVPGGEIQREHAFRLGINIIMYALCVNYKADRVHIPIIMQRRK